MDYFDDPSRRPRKKKNPPRIYSQEELAGLHRAALIARERWRAERSNGHQQIYEKKPVRLRPRKKQRNETQERAKFAAAIARAELRRGYWSGQQEAQLKLARERKPDKRRK